MKNIFIFTTIGFLVSFISMPLIIKLCKKYSVYDYTDERKIHSGNISRLGGIGILAGFFVSAILFLIFTDGIDFWRTFPLFVAGAIIFTFGFIDDLKNLPAFVKLIFQVLAVLIVTISEFRFKQIFGWILPTPLSFVLTFAWILGVINAYNLIDGLDGLCGSLSFTTVITLGVLYSLSNSMEAGVCFCLAGAILGFLCFNWPPAKIFMGDAGSQFLGFMIAILPLYTSGDSFEYNKFFIMIVLTSFPVFDTIAAIWRRLREHRPVMSPDSSHLHHKLLHLGFSKWSALYVVLLFQIIDCVAVIVSQFVEEKACIILLSTTILFMIVFFSIIHYTNYAVMNKNKESAKLVANKDCNLDAENLASKK